MKCHQDVTQLSHLSWVRAFPEVNEDLSTEAVRRRPEGLYSVLFRASKILCGLAQVISKQAFWS